MEVDLTGQTLLNAVYNSPSETTSNCKSSSCTNLTIWIHVNAFEAYEILYFKPLFEKLSDIYAFDCGFHLHHKQ